MPLLRTIRIILCLSLIAAGSAHLDAVCAADTVDLHGDWIVEGQEVRHGEHIRLDGNLVLPSGSALTLEDCTVEITGAYSRQHIVDWKGGRLVTKNCTIGGHVNQQGVPVHTVFHLYEGTWQAEDTTVQYSYGISFHWEKGRGILLRDTPQGGSASRCDHPVG